MTVRTIAVIRGDNDFGNTFRPLLESIYRAFVWNGGLSREVLENAIRAGIEFHYMAFQHGTRFGDPSYGDFDTTIAYLSDIRVLFDEEAEADIAQVNRNAGAWYLEIATGNVYAY